MKGDCGESQKTIPHTFQQRLDRIAMILTAVSCAFSRQSRAEWSKRFDLCVHCHWKNVFNVLSLHLPGKITRSVFL